MNISLHLIAISIITVKIEYKHQLIGTRNAFNQYYDYIVVGAGSAGSVVANRLAENPNINVLLLEAGRAQSVTTDIPANYFQLINSKFDWNYTTVRQKNFGSATKGIVKVSRGKVIGGSSTINGKVYNRGNRRDFDNWVQTYGAKGWSYAEVLPYFIKSEANSDLRLVAQNPGFHGTKGPIGISSDPNPQPILLLNMKAMNELGFKTIDFNGGQQLGTAFAQNYIDSRTGLRSGSGTAYIDPNTYPNNLHILTNAFVIKILFSKANKELKAIGVQFIRHNKTYEVSAKREIIISAGAFNSPQLLMLSGIGPKVHLKQLHIEVKADLPVGQHLQDTPSVAIYAIIKDNIPINPLPELNVQQLYELYANHSGPLSRFTANYVYYSTSANQIKHWPNILIGTAVTSINPGLYAQYTDRRPWAQYFQPYAGKAALVIFSVLTRVKSYGSLELKSNNPYDYPLIDPKFLSDPQDFEDMVESIKFIFYYLLNSSLSKYVYTIPGSIPGCKLCPKQRIYECDQYIRCLIRTVGTSDNHAVGTCRMGSIDRNDIVVDPSLRVKGIRGLRVCDSSVVPQIPNANTNAATVMIGEKCSHLVTHNNEPTNLNDHRKKSNLI